MADISSLVVLPVPVFSTNKNYGRVYKIDSAPSAQALQRNSRHHLKRCLTFSKCHMMIDIHRLRVWRSHALGGLIGCHST
jgi:hypothetical protein